MYFRESIMRYDTRNVREALQHVEATHFTETITRGYDVPVEQDSALQRFVYGMPFTVRDTKIGRGLFATRAFKQGEVIFRESPLACIPDLDNHIHGMCWNCLRCLEETQFGFQNKQIEEQAGVLPPEQFEQFRKEVCASLEIPPLQTCQDAQGNHYCTPSCRTEAHNSFQKTLGEKVAPGTDLHRMLLPSRYANEFNVQDAEKDGQIAFLKELSTIEMVTRLLAQLTQKGVQELEHYNRIAFVRLDPQPLLLEHERMQLDALRQVFPHFKDSLLTIDGYLQLKSVVELNAFSTESHALRIELGVDNNGPLDDMPADADESSAQAMGLHLLMRDDVQVKGSALFRLGSIMNHSCDPNVGISQPALNARASWVALRDISIGEEMFDSYVVIEEGAKHDRELRRQLLFENYHFWCNCSLCSSGK